MDASLARLKGRLEAALERATGELLAARTAGGYWAGELSSSALSTATAVTALSIYARENGEARFHGQITAGLKWLAEHQNGDGGWGDTVLSLSNLSTTVLGWAAFGAAPGGDAAHPKTITAVEDWIRRHAGGLERKQLAPAIIARYGKDRTFSVPILTMCALAGRLGSGPAAWQDIIPLPFELAACPHQWFAALRLPVVSYALPALIAIGQARHFHLPSRNPLARLVRNLTLRRTLRILEGIQPSNGGFLEATPLTSFVTMSLAGSGQAGHPVCRKGIEFLLASQRADGSWPIDTNLATWGTTSAVNALGGHLGDGAEAESIRSWLLGQQYLEEHPYTHAAPGGWAWTDLPGGVPDADDTAGALVALRQLGGPMEQAAAGAGLRWLLDLQNRDGGIPTFCRGWGALPFDRSSADLTAHAIRAWLAWMDEPELVAMRERIEGGVLRALRYLRREQRQDGSWVPLWFGNQHAPGEENATYGTSRVVRALSEVAGREWLREDCQSMLGRGVQWLMEAQNGDGSWGGCRKIDGSVEETALAVEGLAAAAGCEAWPSEVKREMVVGAVGRGAEWLIQKVESGEWKQPSPIGFYFAKLWYYEALYPVIFTVGALGQAAKFIR